MDNQRAQQQQRLHRSSSSCASNNNNIYTTTTTTTSMTATNLPSIQQQQPSSSPAVVALRSPSSSSAATTTTANGTSISYRRGPPCQQPSSFGQPSQQQQQQQPSFPATPYFINNASNNSPSTPMPYPAFYPPPFSTAQTLTTFSPLPSSSAATTPPPPPPYGDPRYFTLTMPYLPPHRYVMANIGSRMPHMVYNVWEIDDGGDKDNDDADEKSNSKKVVDVDCNDCERNTVNSTTSSPATSTNIHTFSTIHHRPPKTCSDTFAITLVKTVGWVMNAITGFDHTVVGKTPKSQWVSRAVFLESVAAVPGSIAALVRHLDSLRRMKRDHGWVRHLLEEADNERMHLFFFLREKNPSVFFRVCVWFTQFGFLLMTIVFYLVSPRTMHRFVGYLEEEAVKTYNAMLREIDDDKGVLKEWRHKPAPRDMAAYYCLPDDLHSPSSFSSRSSRLSRRGGEGKQSQTIAGNAVQDVHDVLNKYEKAIAENEFSRNTNDDVNTSNNSNTCRTASPPRHECGYVGPTYRDIILCIRADETGHREHNHMFADLHGEGTERMVPRETLEIVSFTGGGAGNHGVCGSGRGSDDSGGDDGGVGGDKAVRFVLNPSQYHQEYRNLKEQQQQRAQHERRRSSSGGCGTGSGEGSDAAQSLLLPKCPAAEATCVILPIVGGGGGVGDESWRDEAQQQQQSHERHHHHHPSFSSSRQHHPQHHPHHHRPPPPLPILSSAVALEHAQAQQHLFTTSVSISDPYYLEV